MDIGKCDVTFKFLVTFHSMFSIMINSYSHIHVHPTPPVLARTCTAVLLFSCKIIKRKTDGCNFLVQLMK